MLPTFVNLAIQLIKGTSLVSLITLTDMTFRAKEISQRSYDPVGVYSGLLLSYLIICYPVTIFGRRVQGSFAYLRGQALALRIVPRVCSRASETRLLSL
jgi:polar amino acid transport system permease protein